jgi:hypothetical protein
MAKKAEVTDEFIQKATASGKQYCLRLYRVGPKRDQPPEEADRIQMEHLRYLFQLRAEGKIVINGRLDEPAFRDGDLQHDDKEEVKIPRRSAVKAGRVVYGSPLVRPPGDCLPE